MIQWLLDDLMVRWLKQKKQWLDDSMVCVWSDGKMVWAEKTATWWFNGLRMKQWLGPMMMMIKERMATKELRSGMMKLKR